MRKKLLISYDHVWYFTNERASLIDIIVKTLKRGKVVITKVGYKDSISNPEKIYKLKPNGNYFSAYQIG